MTSCHGLIRGAKPKKTKHCSGMWRVIGDCLVTHIRSALLNEDLLQVKKIKLFMKWLKKRIYNMLAYLLPWLHTSTSACLSGCVTVCETCMGYYVCMHWSVHPRAATTYTHTHSQSWKNSSGHLHHAYHRPMSNHQHACTGLRIQIIVGAMVNNRGGNKQQ